MHLDALLSLVPSESDEGSMLEKVMKPERADSLQIRETRNNNEERKSSPDS